MTRRCLARAQPMSPLPNLVYYAAVAKGPVVLAQYGDGDSSSSAQNGLPHIALQCLHCLPPLHSRVSYTADHRRFICLIEGLFVYCAITDEALGKCDTFSFLHGLRDAFVALLEKLVADVETLTSHSLDEHMTPCIRSLAAPLVGLPQKEKELLDADLWAKRVILSGYGGHYPCMVAPLHMESRPMEDEKHVKFWFLPRLTSGKGKDGKKKAMVQVDKGREMGVNSLAVVQGSKLDIVVGKGSSALKVGDITEKQREREYARRLWWLKVWVIVMMDMLVCLILLMVWLVMCHGFSCLKRN